MLPIRWPPLDVSILQATVCVYILWNADVCETRVDRYPHSQGELFDYLIARQKLSEKEARTFFKQMIKALHYCHSQGVVHRDLKLENLLLDENHDLKVADFGFSKKMHNPYGPDGLCNTFVGSPAYSAPEIHENTQYDGTAADVWSIGVILLTILTGSHPFQDANEALKLQRIDEAHVEIPDDVGEEAKDLIKKVIRRNPADRLTVQQIWEHPWVAKGNMDSLVMVPVKADAVVVDRVFARMEELAVDVPKAKRDLAAGVVSHETASYHLLLDKAIVVKKEEDAAAEIAARANSLCSLIGSPARISRGKAASPWATPVPRRKFNPPPSDSWFTPSPHRTAGSRAAPATMPARPPASRVHASETADEVVAAGKVGVGDAAAAAAVVQTEQHPFFLQDASKLGAESSTDATSRAGTAGEDAATPTPVAGGGSATPAAVEYSPFERSGKRFTKQSFATPRHGGGSSRRVGMRKVAASTGRRGAKHKRKFLIKDSGAFAAAFPDKRVVEIGKGNDLRVLTAPAPLVMDNIGDSGGADIAADAASVAAAAERGTFQDDVATIIESTESMSVLPQSPSRRGRPNRMSSQWAAGDVPHNLRVASPSGQSIRAKSDGAVSPEERKRRGSALSKPTKSEGNRRVVSDNSYRASAAHGVDGSADTSAADGNGDMDDAISEETCQQVFGASSNANAGIDAAEDVLGGLDSKTTSPPKQPQPPPDGARGRRMSAFGADTTTTLHAAEIVKVLKRALAVESISFTQPHALKLVCEARTVPTTNTAAGLLHRKKTTLGKLVKWEMEICELERLDMRGIKLRRLVGDIWAYKRLIGTVMSIVNQNSSTTSKVKVKVL